MAVDQINKRLVFLTLTLFSPFLSMAQEVEMADGLRGTGKFYVVLVIIAMVLTGLFAYLVYLDRKVNRLKKEQEAS